jgi:hypothetical protein
VKPKELKDALQSGLIIDIGGGETVFSGSAHNSLDEFIVDFNLLDNPVVPGNDVPIEACKEAETYLRLSFNNLASFKVFAEFVGKFYSMVKDGDIPNEEVVV